MYALFGLLCHPSLVGASRPSKQTKIQAREHWTGYLSNSVKEHLRITIPRPSIDIPPVEDVTEAEHDAWAGRMKSIHEWCLQNVSIRRGEIFPSYLNLIQSWFPKVALSCSTESI